MISRRDFITQSILGTAALNAPGWAMASNADKAAKPNVVFILCDDLGYGDLSCYGHPIIQTPCLDALAQEGVQLTDCYASAPVCSPSRAGIMTGRTPTRCRIMDWIPPKSGVYLKRDEITIASLLNASGYATAHIGKWHLNSVMNGSEPTPGDHGFDVWFSTQNNAIPSHRDPVNFLRNGKPEGKREGFSSAIVVDESLRFLRQAKDRPFALFVWFHSPHEPIATADEFQKMYASVKDESEAIYYGNVSQTDHETGRLLKALDEMNLRDNTFVMFTSDNGPETFMRYKTALYSHGSPGALRGMKLHMREGGCRIPGIVRWPGKSQPATVCSEPVNGTDVLPTLCEVAGIEPPKDRAIDGASIAPIFHNKTIPRQRPLYWRYDNALTEAKIAMRQGDWKILSDLKFEKMELYNLKDDLPESNNLVNKHPQKLNEMLAQLKAIHVEVEGDPISKG